MNNKTINPELVLEAKKLAYGDIADRLRRDFDMLDFPVDQVRLEDALMEESNGHWRFGKSIDNTRYVASCSGGAQKGTIVTEKSRHMLLFKCVSAMAGLPLYMEGV
jgi:hypothetical protein